MEALQSFNSLAFHFYLAVVSHWMVVVRYELNSRRPLLSLDEQFNLNSWSYRVSEFLLLSDYFCLSQKDVASILADLSWLDGDEPIECLD